MCSLVPALQRQLPLKYQPSRQFAVAISAADEQVSQVGADTHNQPSWAETRMKSQLIHRLIYIIYVNDWMLIEWYRAYISLKAGHDIPAHGQWVAQKPLYAASHDSGVQSAFPEQRRSRGGRTPLNIWYPGRIMNAVHILRVDQNSVLLLNGTPIAKWQSPAHGVVRPLLHPRL